MPDLPDAYLATTGEHRLQRYRHTFARIANFKAFEITQREGKAYFALYNNLPSVLKGPAQRENPVFNRGRQGVFVRLHRPFPRRCAWSVASIDRDLVYDGKKQLYGSQLMKNKAGKLEPSPVEDESRLDERRAGVGLEPIATYLRRFNTQGPGDGGATP